MHIFVRPFACKMIQNLSNYFNIVVFSMGLDQYVEKIVQILDPSRRFIKQSFSRSSTRSKKDMNSFIKDLNVINSNTSLTNVIMIDNTYKTIMQKANLLPVVNYEGEQNEDGLIELEKYILTFKELEDVRPQLKADFGDQVKMLKSCMSMAEVGGDMSACEQIQKLKKFI